jgi:hypothetical protein
MVIDEIDFGRVLTLDPRVTLAMDERFLARGVLAANCPTVKLPTAPSVASQAVKPVAGQIHADASTRSDRA